MLEMIGIYGEMRSYVKFSLQKQQKKMFGYISYYIKGLKKYKNAMRWRLLVSLVFEVDLNMSAVSN